MATSCTPHGPPRTGDISRKEGMGRDITKRTEKMSIANALQLFMPAYTNGIHINMRKYDKQITGALG